MTPPPPPADRTDIVDPSTRRRSSSAWLRRRVDLVVAAVAGLATVVVLAANIGRSYDFDESFAVGSTISLGSARYALTNAAVFNNHPIFAAVQSEWWAAGATTESTQRILPILYGALAVAVLTAWIIRRWGVAPGLAAALVVAANPMFVSQGRAVRGYSLAMLGVVVALICLLEYIRLDEPRRPRGLALLAGHAAGIVIAMGTHGFAGVALGPVGLAALVLLGRIDPRVVASWVVAGVGVALVYVWTIGDLLDTADDRGNRYFSFLGELTFEEILGRDPVTVSLLGGLVVVGALAMFVAPDEWRPRARTASIIIVVLVVAQFLVLWQVVQPRDLYPRFFLVVVPLAAIAVALAVRHQAALLLVIVVAAGFAVDEVREVRDAELPLRDAGALVIAADELGLDTCAVGRATLFLYAGGVQIETVAIPDDPTTVDFGDCEVFIRITSTGRAIEPMAEERFAHDFRLRGIRVFSQVPPERLGR
ncbi:MAG: hypothetical protein AAF081_04290 [Actinomycetota bacterium]